MAEAQLEGVQRQSSDRIYLFQSVASVANDGMSQVLHVHADLVFASRLQHQFHEREAVGAFDGAVVGDCFLAAIVRGAGVYVQLAVGEP